MAKNKKEIYFKWRQRWPSLTNEVTLTKTDKIRREVVNLVVVIVAPVFSILAYWKITGDEFFLSEFGQIIMIGLGILSMIVASVIYEYLFPKYKDDIS